MKLVYYAFKNENGDVIAPFLEYLEKYNFNENSPDAKKIKQLANIEAHINHVLERGGKYNLPPIAEEYVDDIGFIKIKESKTLIRIAFITFVDKKMVVLDAMEKPSLYEKRKKKKIDKEIQEHIKLMQEYREDYLETGLHVEFEEG